MDSSSVPPSSPPSAVRSTVSVSDINHTAPPSPNEAAAPSPDTLRIPRRRLETKIPGRRLWGKASSTTLWSLCRRAAVPPCRCARCH
ncbi:uncharacterized protein UV8b_00979 [Ustilaginoidea virens]|uniref:Uncharacterized protein n=1 Tax=Ustilaginoidea virens TaxID=1159556 RepID=A0A8E5HJW2_USTVR|nr:uncharacterized protein UV8b_00979 [Ustilaginoidea virens]QUC16738.1 hypothetical protein UV8b_00979 [Ustilaginoidea virens]